MANRNKNKKLAELRRANNILRKKLEQERLETEADSNIYQPDDQEFEYDHNLTPDKISKSNQTIDRKVRRGVHDDNLVGLKDDIILGDDETPLLFNPDNFLDRDKTLLGGLNANALFLHIKKIEDNVGERLSRYNLQKSSLQHPEIKGVLNIYADETTTEDIMGEIYHVSHPKQEAADCVDDCFERLGAHDKLWNIVFNMCAHGDDFWELVPSKDLSKLLKMQYIPRDMIEVVEENGSLKGYNVIEHTIDKWTGNKKFEVDQEAELIYPWRLVHFKLPSTIYDPYGESIIDCVLPLIEQLRLMERALLIARVSRSAERRVYNINVGQLHSEKAMKFAYEVVNASKTRKRLSNFFDEQYDFSADVFGASEDIILPRRQGDEPNTIDVLPQANNLSEIGDIEYLRDKIFPGIGVPRQYLFDDAFANANMNLSSKSVPFAKKIRRIQRFLLYCLYKIAYIELKLQGFSNDDIMAIEITMNNPSNIAERERIETQTSLWSLVSTIQSVQTQEGKPMFPEYLIFRDILGYSKDEIREIYQMRELEAQFAQAPAGDMEGGQGGAPGGGMAGFDDMGGSMDMGEEGMEGGEDFEGGEDAAMDMAVDALGGEPMGDEGGAEFASKDPDYNMTYAYAEELKKKLIKQAVLANKQADLINKSVVVQHKPSIFDRDQHTVRLRSAYTEMELRDEFLGLKKEVNFILESKKEKKSSIFE